MTAHTGASAWTSLEAVAAEVRACRKCRLCEGRTNAVPGEGSSLAAVMFIGEGPGFNEDQQGRPFVGRAGKLLDDLLEAVPLKRADVYITNVVKCRPPDNRDPEPDEVAACWPYLEAQIALIRPRVIATLGRHSMARFYPEGKISRDHGQLLKWRDIVVFPLYHPAAALRSGAVMEALAADFKRLPEAVVASLRDAPSPRKVGAVPPTLRPGSGERASGTGAQSAPAGDGEARPGTPPDETRQISMF